MDAFVALADPTRRALLSQLRRDGECSVGALVASHTVSQPAISRHLGVLRKAGLVHVRREGRHRWYRLDPDGLLPIAGYLSTFWDQRFAALEAVLDDLEETDP